MPLPTFTDALEAMDEALGSSRFDGYGPRPIPHELDLLPERFVQSYELAEPGERALIQGLGRRAAPVLLAYGERQASRAVRTRSPEALRLSVLAMGLAAVVADDEREVMRRQPLAWHAAATLGVQPAALFALVAERLPATGRASLFAFSRRAAKDQSLECMGYEEGADDAGFRFVRTG
jgi:hypothetical protein